MKVLHITYDDIYGAGKAACRINDAVIKEGADSKICVLNKGGSRSVQVEYSKTERRCRYLVDRLNRKRSNKDIDTVYMGILPRKLKSEIDQADVLHLHWINAGLWSTKLFNYIRKRKKPIIWTLHDMWAFTGGCHYNDTCMGVIDGCNNCTRINSRFARQLRDVKTNKFKAVNLVFVGCSRWISEESKKSYISRNSEVETISINNPIEDKIFHFYRKELVRELLNIHTKKYIVLFGSATNLEKRKGYSYLKDAINMLDKTKYCLIVFGDEVSRKDFDGYDIILAGYISDEIHLAMLYGAADVYVAPSMQENLSNSVMESLSCGTPVVAFNVGGMNELIVNGENGFLTSPFNIEEFSSNIERACQIKEHRNISENTIKKFNKSQIGIQYVELYHRMMNKDK